MLHFRTFCTSFQTNFRHLTETQLKSNVLEYTDTKILYQAITSLRQCLKQSLLQKGNLPWSYFINVFLLHCKIFQRFYLRRFLVVRQLVVSSSKPHPLVVLHIGSKRTCASDVTCNVASVPASPCTITVVPNVETIQYKSQ